MHWHTHENFREMPWKESKNPYFIWLSEIILQQTRVEQGLSYYKKFIEAYPSVEDLAKAKDTDVFKLWEGLGYYSRCRNLLITAREINLRYSNIFPGSFEALLTLKGIGPYTAAAIASFAFNKAHAVADGNVYRVIARYFGIHAPVDALPTVKLIRDIAQTLLHKKLPGAYNQAIMDLGATVCKPKNPLCDACPLQPKCIAYANGWLHLPNKQKKAPKKTRWMSYVIATTSKKILVSQRQEKDIWQQLHQFFLIESAGQLAAEDILQTAEFINAFTLPYTIKTTSKPEVQQLTHQTIRGIKIQIVLENEIPVPGYRWISFKMLKNLAFPKFLSADVLPFVSKITP